MAPAAAPLDLLSHMCHVRPCFPWAAPGQRRSMMEFQGVAGHKAPQPGDVGSRTPFSLADAFRGLACSWRLFLFPSGGSDMQHGPFTLSFSLHRGCPLSLP